jgi:hypothetical protein
VAAQQAGFVPCFRRPSERLAFERVLSMTINHAELRLKALEESYHSGHCREYPLVLKEAFEICRLNQLDFPFWVIDGLGYERGNEYFDIENQELEESYNTGNLGAVLQMVYCCDHYKKPLPKWVVNGLNKAINTLAKGDTLDLKAWRDWYKDYQKHIVDNERYTYVLSARELGSTQIDSWEIAAAFYSNKFAGEYEKSPSTFKKSYNDVTNRLKKNTQYRQMWAFPYRWKNRPINQEIWDWAKKTIAAGNPKPSKKSK